MANAKGKAKAKTNAKGDAIEMTTAARGGSFAGLTCHYVSYTRTRGGLGERGREGGSDNTRQPNDRTWTNMELTSVRRARQKLAKSLS